MTLRPLCYQLHPRGAFVVRNGQLCQQFLLLEDSVGTPGLPILDF